MNALPPKSEIEMKQSWATNHFILHQGLKVYHKRLTRRGTGSQMGLFSLQSNSAQLRVLGNRFDQIRDRIILTVKIKIKNSFTHSKHE